MYKCCLVDRDEMSFRIGGLSAYFSRIFDVVTSAQAKGKELLYVDPNEYLGQGLLAT